MKSSNRAEATSEILLPLPRRARLARTTIVGQPSRLPHRASRPRTTTGAGPPRRQARTPAPLYRNPLAVLSRRARCAASLAVCLLFPPASFGQGIEDIIKQAQPGQMTTHKGPVNYQPAGQP